MAYLSHYINLDDDHKDYGKIGITDIVTGNLTAEKQLRKEQLRMVSAWEMTDSRALVYILSYIIIFLQEHGKSLIYQDDSIIFFCTVFIDDQVSFPLLVYFYLAFFILIKSVR